VKDNCRVLVTSGYEDLLLERFYFFFSNSIPTR
jgi:hypothetical protein